MDLFDVLNTVLLAVIAGSSVWIGKNVVGIGENVRRIDANVQKLAAGPGVTPWPKTTSAGVLSGPLGELEDDQPSQYYLADLACGIRTLTQMSSSANERQATSAGQAVS